MSWLKKITKREQENNTMRNHHITLFIIAALATPFLIIQPTNGTTPKIQDFIGDRKTRRILHQPLFPTASTPPPALEPPPSSTPPPTTVFPNPDQPFFREGPAGPTTNQGQQPPATALNGTSIPVPIATQPTKPTKKVAIALSVGIVTLGMLLGLAFYLYKHRVKQPDESQKLVGDNSQGVNEESRLPPSSFLYIGTVEPSSQRAVSDTNGSPYHKLSSTKRSDRYRPSPDLQPLPPLSKPQPPPIMNSPPAMSSDDEESQESAFYTPHGSSVSNEEGYSTSSRQSRLSNSTKTQSAIIEPHVTIPVPHSKRTSPRSRLSVSSADTKHAIIQSIKQPPPTPQPPPPPPAPVVSSRPIQKQPQAPSFEPALAYSHRRAKFSAPPPPPDLTTLHSTNDQSQRTSEIPIPPPPPQLVKSHKIVASERNAPSMDFQKMAKSLSKSLIRGAEPEIVKSECLEEDYNATSLEKIDDDEMDGPKPKLKPLHWDKVRATSDKATVWDQLKPSSFQLNEDMMESLFGCSSASSSSVPKEAAKKSVLPPVQQENRVLDPKKSQNIAILLRALNVTRDEVTEALLDGNPEGLGADLLETLVKMGPTKEEEIKLRDYRGDLSKLGSAERFLKAILDVPFAFKRVEVMLYRANFDAEIKYLRSSFQTIEAASEELKNSRLFLKLLEAVLRTGNRMNVGTNRGDARAFKLDTLLKLVDIKGTDGKTTLLHFVVQEIIRSEGMSSESSDPVTEILPNKTSYRVKEEDFKKQGLQVVAGLGRELTNVKRAAGMDADVLSSYFLKLETGLEKVRLVLQYETPNMQGKFFESLKSFLREAEEEISRIKSDERKILSLVKEVTAYFHGDTVKEEAHPFRIFMIVRDFLCTLDNVCKEVGRMQDKTMVGSARSFRIPATTSLPVLNRYNVHQDRSSNEESSSP